MTIDQVSFHRPARDAPAHHHQEAGPLAEQLNLSGVAIKRRNPWGVWGLSLITFGVYGIVWWYKINAEMRDYSAAAGRPLGNSPATPVLAIIPGSMVLVPAILTYVHTARRVREIQALTSNGAIVDGVSSPLVVLLALVGGFHAIYLQSALNSAYDRARSASLEGRVSSAPATA